MRLGASRRNLSASEVAILTFPSAFGRMRSWNSFSYILPQQNLPKDAFWMFSGRFEGVLERLECALGHLGGIRVHLRWPF